MESLKSKIEIEAGLQQSYDTPPVNDPDGDEFSISVELGSAAPFTSYTILNQQQIQFTFKTAYSNI